jgi:serine phosphatase RsbU (regulator of sigma subunit)
MTRLDFDALMVRQPQLAYTMVQTLTKRLDATNTVAFRDLQEKNRQLQKAYDELKAAQVQIIEKERLERELQLAAEIQVSILPQELPSATGYSFGALMQPARMVGGDFYDIFSLDDAHVGVMIGDVTDKGIPAAIFMARSHALLMAETNHGGSPAEILRSADGVVQTLPQATGQPVGIFDDLLLDENFVPVPPGGTLVLFSDGLTDCRSPGGEAFGHARVSSVLGGQLDRNGQQVCDALVEALMGFQSGAPQDDDVTIVVITRLVGK